MAPINETKDAPSHEDDSTDQLDALFATFRLPVPIATKGKYTSNLGDAAAPSPTSHLDGWLLQALDLMRLLHTMETQYANPKQSSSTPSDSVAPCREKTMESQIRLAIKSLERIETSFPTMEKHLLLNNENNAQQEEGVIHHVFLQNIHNLLQKIRHDTDETCGKYQRYLDSRQRHLPTERDLIYDIFLAPAHSKTPTIEEGDDESDVLDEFSDEEEDNGDGEDGKYANHNAAAENISSAPDQNKQRQRQQPQPQEELDPIEFQKLQQELLEAELASMASRLKSSTLAMNTTLQTQTKELDDMEELAQKNLDTVSDTAKKVGERLVKKKGWKKRIATWSIIGTVVGLWALCFMIMRTVPKRPIGDMPPILENVQRSVQYVKPHVQRGLKYVKHKGDYAYAIFKEYFMEDEDRYDGEWEEEMDRRREGRQSGGAYADWKSKEEQKYKQQQQQQQRQECEVGPDGTQVCYESEEVKARELAADRKRRRREEKMANARARPAVDAVDSEGENEPTTEEEKEEAAPMEEESSTNDNVDPMGCVPPTKEIKILKAAVGSLTHALKGIEQRLAKAPESGRAHLSKQRDKLQNELKQNTSRLQLDMNKAKSLYWADPNVRRRAASERRALGSIQFCADDEGTSSDSKMDGQQPPRQDDDEAVANERIRLEMERQQKFQEEVRLAREAEQKAEERIAAELKNQADLKKMEEEQIKHAEQLKRERALKAARMQKERLAAEEADRLQAEKLAAQEAARIEAERVEEERLAAARIEAQRIEKEKLAAAESARLQAERNEKEKFEAAEAARLEAERIEQEGAAAAELDSQMREKMHSQMRSAFQRNAEQQKQRIVEGDTGQTLVDSPEAKRRDRSRKKMLAAQSAQRAFAERQRKEELEEDQRRQQAEARLKVEEEELQKELARIAAEEIREKEQRDAERLEAERKEQERKTAEARDRQMAQAKADAEQAIKQSKDIAEGNSDFLPSDVRNAAGRLKNDLLAHYITTSPEIVDASDRSGWRPIHEAARSGNLAGVELLVNAGADLNSRTGRKGTGGTALWWAIQRHGENHVIVEQLRKHGALEAGPEK